MLNPMVFYHRLSRASIRGDFQKIEIDKIITKPQWKIMKIFRDITTFIYIYIIPKNKWPIYFHQAKIRKN